MLLGDSYTDSGDMLVKELSYRTRTGYTESGRIYLSQEHKTYDES